MILYLEMMCVDDLDALKRHTFDSIQTCEIALGFGCDAPAPDGSGLVVRDVCCDSCKKLEEGKQIERNLNCFFLDTFKCCYSSFHIDISK